MQPISVTETIQAPIDAVFAVVSDIPNAAGRIRGIVAIEMLTDPPVGPGTTWRETRLMFGKKASETMSITNWDPPRGYVVEAHSCGTHYRTPLMLEDLGGGITRVTMTFNATPETFMARVLSRVFAGMTKHLTNCLRDDLADLKAACEMPRP